MTTPDPSRRARQQDLRRLLVELAASGKNWHAIDEGLSGRGAGRLVLRPGVAAAPPRPAAGNGPSVPDNHAASWYFRYTDPAGKRPWVYIGVCDSTRKAGLDLDDALFEARKLSEELRGPAGGDLIAYRAQEQRRKEEALAEQHQREAQQGKTLRLLLETYIQWLKDQGKDRSAYDTKNALDKHLFERWPALCTKPAAQVKRRELSAVVRGLIESGKKRTAGKVRSFIRAAYQAALSVEDDVEVNAAFLDFGIEDNPMAAVTYRGAGVRESKRKVPPQALGHLLVLLRNETSTAAKALRILIDLAGQRQQQLWRVPLADVDLDANTLQQLDGKGNRPEPRKHEVPLVGRTRHQVAALVQASRRLGTPLLFTTDGVHPLRDETVRELFRALATKVCALEGSAGTVYSLRNIRCTAESKFRDWRYRREESGHLLSHGLGGVQARHYEDVELDEIKRAMLRQWQSHLLALERAAWRDIRKRAANKEAPFVALLRDLAAGTPARAGMKKSVAAKGVRKLSLAASNAVADPLLRLAGVLALLPISESMLRKLRQSGEFPPPALQLGRTPLWHRSQVDAFIAQALVQQPAGTPRARPRLQVVGR